MNLDFREINAQALQRRRMLLQESETQRMIAQMTVYKPALYRRVLANLGEIMIISGTKLKVRYQTGTRLAGTAPFRKPALNR